MLARTREAGRGRGAKRGLRIQNGVVASETMIRGWSPPLPATKTRPSSFPTGTTSSPAITTSKPSQSVTGANPSCSSTTQQSCISSGHGLCRLCLDYCFDLLVPGILASSAILCFDAVAATRGIPSVPSAYPCEDVRGYYSPADGLEGTPLMERLSSVISPHHSLPYKQVWDALKILDAADVDDPEASSEIIEIYSSRAVPKALAGKPEGWNREHLWPRSYGLIDGPSVSDLHNLRPADMNVNSSRGNKYYGECVAVSTDCLRPANREAAPDTETDNQRWAPPLKVRGDIARSLMYMAVRYGFHQPDGNPRLQLSDSPSIERRKMGLLSALLRWNELDPPSRAEQLRNDRICKLYQHNRNPFIDHPEYANLIWKHASQSSAAGYYPSLKAWINEFHYKNNGKDRNEFVEIVIGSSTDAAELKLILYNGANGRVYRSLSLVDKHAFSISNNNIGSGFLIYTAFLPLQNGPADGIALVSGWDGDGCEVVQFLSYEGVVEARDGPATGIESIDIMVRETEESSERDSVGLAGEKIGEFKWGRFIGKATPGKMNIGQKI